MDFEQIAFVALGSNLGDSAGIFQAAVKEMQRWTPLPLLQSSFRTTAPVNCPPGSPSFLNAVVGLVLPNPIDPQELLARLQALERTFGRQPKKVLNEPRPLDLDFIAYGWRTCRTPELILPHPRAHERRFVLEPFSEIAPEFILPGQSLTVKELYTNELSRTR